MVPHLSTQIFNIVVETQTNEYVNATDITIDTLDAPSGDVETTPIYFKFNVTYQSISNLNCTLNIPEASFAQSGFNMSINEDLENGSYSWQYYCFDETNLSINDIENGAFTINEEFSIITFRTQTM